MLEEIIIKKSLENLYDLIEEYYKKIIILNKNNKDLTQDIIDYEASIYRNIKNKLIPFTQIFDLNNPNPYILNDFEIEVLRKYIGIYNYGNKESKKEISKIFNVSPSTISNTLKRIIEALLDPGCQKKIIDERNKLIRENIKNKALKNKILNLDISFLNITENLETILRLTKINTIKDIINIDYETIEKMNIEYGYYAGIIVFPKCIINEIHELGLNFKKENMIYELNKQLDEMEIPIEKALDVENYTTKISTVADLFLSQQFERELLKTFSIEDTLKIDWLINNSYINDEYIRFVIENSLEPSPKENKVATNTKEMIERKFLYATEEEVDELVSKTDNLFEIYNESEIINKIDKNKCM